MSPRLPLLALALLSLPACFTVRGSAGPVMTPKREVGMDATFAVGAGDGLGRDRAWFVTSEFGFGLSPVGTEPGLVLQAGVDYVSQEAAARSEGGIAWRAGGRLGARLVFIDEEETVGYNTVGAAIAIFPLNWISKGGGRASHEKIGDIFNFGDTRGYTNLGVELSAERMFSREADDAWLVSLQLVFDMNTFD